MPKPTPATNRPLREASVHGRAFARLGLLGNPSDAYQGKALAVSLYEFSAEVRLDPLAEAGVLRAPGGLAHDLIAAACRRYAREVGLEPQHESFAVDVTSTVPFQVGLAGSSAIVIACLRALGSAFDRPLDTFALSEMALTVEVDDLGIAAGPMDRAIQAYEGAVHMDFSGERSPASYTPLAREDLPPLLVAWDPAGGEASGRVHSDVRERWYRGDAEVVRAMREFASLVDTGMEALHRRDAAAFRKAVDRNFDARCELFAVGQRDREKVAIARAAGAAAKLCGSGGAAVAVLSDRNEAAALAARYRDAGFEACIPGASAAAPPTGVATR